ncbi:hypothetical protein [Erythrobacter litoralis]|uniref:Uncharacterized protein n=1 Tax=Erythrobacter litoralis (strain HTCC2594) TaxID=314225 RepID=Q2N8P5_ERYLH|nr:hypothetical protein [Erythrobacter litoralis]ABC63946.1 hypothetical protein ELI_09270 [Erythrobacter litoralis HTCC2594]
MKPVRVVLGAVPQLIEAIMRDVLSGSAAIEIVEVGDKPPHTDYDVLVLNSLEGDVGKSGYARPRPNAGIVMVASEGRTASVFKRLSEDLHLDESASLALENAILLAADRR